MEVSYHRFPSGKMYACMIQPSGPVFIRNMILLTKENDPATIVIVHEWGKGDTRWEPPKGQMEWKEFDDLNIKPNTKLPISQLQENMRKGILREMGEEAYILKNEIKNFHMLPLIYEQAWPESKIPNAKFMYQFWTAEITEETMQKAKKRLHQLVANPDWKLILPPDLSEKDNIEWWNPSKGWKKIRSGFSKKMTQHYYSFLDKHGVFKYT